ncbi:MAG: right-handed parallel beta-helix repeat-containing protein [Bdellovibrio sp.]|nr:right-handed parallel beta-helix repeat-containing protein [Bdellovibrio sp.]
MRRLIYLPVAAYLVVIATVQAFGASPCSENKMNEILALADEQNPQVKVDCHVSLPNKETIITKKIIIQGDRASGVVFNCNGGTIRPTQKTGYSIAIRSVQDSNDESIWSRPTDVSIKNCTIEGAVRIYGMARNGEGDDLRRSSYQTGHTARVQRNAPRNITLDNVVIIGSGTIPLYFSPGVTHSVLKNSEIKGKGSSVAVYLDAESAYNTLKDNSIHLETESREQVALDGSAYNKIMGNRFSGLNHGGIYLYRNCGEGGTVRHQAPQHNQMINNVFYYNKYDGGNPAIWLGSRNGFWRKLGTLFHLSYCHDDDGFNFGSSKSNRDYARYNVVAQNQIYKLRSSKMIVNDDESNFITANQTVQSEIERLSGCVLSLDGENLFVTDNDYIATRTSDYYGLTYTCDDGEFHTTTELAIQKMPFSCARSNSNSGCNKAVSCPNNKKIVGLKGVCNLESSSLPVIELQSTSLDLLRVARSSDRVSDGLCKLGGVSLSHGQRWLNTSLSATKSIEVACKEYDKNGGDCLIQGEILCL